MLPYEQPECVRRHGPKFLGSAHVSPGEYEQLVHYFELHFDAIDRVRRDRRWFDNFERELDDRSRKMRARPSNSPS